MAISSSSSSSSSRSPSSSSASTPSSSTPSSSSSSEVRGTILSFSGTGVAWNKSKHLSTEATAVSLGDVQNRLAQTFGVNTLEYNVGGVALFLRERQGTSGEDFPIVVEVREADADGLPSGAVVAESSRLASEVTWTGWHVFPVSMEEAPSPASGMLSVVVRQDGGDEDNYVAWAYSHASLPGAKAFYSSDWGSSWDEHAGVVRLIRIVRSYNPFASLCEARVLR